MKKYLLLLLLLVACVPPQTPQLESAPKPAAEDGSVATFVVTPPAGQPPAVPPSDTEVSEETLTPLEPTGSKIEPYSKLGCSQLLTNTDFANVCGKSNVKITSQIGTKNCYVNLKDYENERLTAGVSLIGFKNAEDAMTEFERRLKVFNVGADKSVGERAYTFPKLDRETLVFVRSEYLVEVGSDTRLCTDVQVKQLAMVVDSRLK